MIRTLLDDHRSGARSLFILAFCVALGWSADRVAADPSDLEQLGKRSTSWRLPNELGDLKVVVLERTIVIGPVPGVAPPYRYPRHWTPAAATPRGPRSKERSWYHVLFSLQTRLKR